jgi:hypothetical protein
LIAGSLVSVMQSTLNALERKSLRPKGYALPAGLSSSNVRDDRTLNYCLRCASARNVRTIMVPYVLRYLAAELFAANIRLQVRTDAQPDECDGNL